MPPSPKTACTAEKKTTYELEKNNRASESGRRERSRVVFFFFFFPFDRTSFSNFVRERWSEDEIKQKIALHAGHVTNAKIFFSTICQFYQVAERERDREREKKKEGIKNNLLPV